MAVVVAAEDEEKFVALAGTENLEAYRAAVVTESPRMVMKWRGTVIADLSRAFLDTNGAVKRATVTVGEKDRTAMGQPRYRSLRELASSLPCASRRGLVERFDSTIGAGSVTMPFGGKTQRTPAQSMTALLPVLPGQRHGLRLRPGAAEHRPLLRDYGRRGHLPDQAGGGGGGL